MNVVRFNDPFIDAIKIWPKADLTFDYQSQRSSKTVAMPFKNWEHSPLFQYTTTRSKEKAMLKHMLDNGIRLEDCPWPFETFRISITQYCDELWETDGVRHGEGYYRANFVATRRNERVFFLGNIIRLYDETPADQAAARRYNPLIIYMHDAYTSLDNPQEYGYQQSTFAGGRWLKQHLATAITQGLMDSLAGFILDSMTPSNHIAEVRPNEPTRSVEWIKARTHYTLITHGHPANKRTVRERERVIVDQKAELLRACGNRRAHYKQLRHPRYKYALNEKRFPDMPKGTIHVKACWVGPREWQDEGGNQIYKILEPPGEERKAA